MMQRVLKNKWQEQWISATLILLIAGLMVSRALLSLASVAMIIPFFSLYRQQPLKKPVLLGIGLILFPVLISGFWSEDKNEWWNSISLKIPLLTMMLGLSVTRLTKQRWLQIACIYIIIITLGCCWSLLQYANNSKTIEAAYLQAKIFSTPADNDYIRFSWMVVLAVVLAIKCLAEQTDKKIKFLLSLLAVFLVVYLHLLASRTGLLCLYTCSLLYLFQLIFHQKKWKTALVFVSVMFAMGMFAYKTLPTLHNRVQYIMFDFSNYSKGDFLPGYTDGSRLLSLKAGYDITQAHPLTGVGFGDVRKAIHQWHENEHPTSFAWERFLPSDEWLVYGAGSGWPGLLSFTAGILLLLYASTSKNIISVLLSVVALIPFITDDSLEGQYGVVILAFIAFFGQQNSQHQTNTI